MAEFIEVFKQRKRMCESYTDQFGITHCEMCTMCKIPSCSYYIFSHPQEAESIIMKWAEEHPIKTNADKFKEVFGVEPNRKGCAGIQCPKGCADCANCNMYGFWEQEYKE